MKRTNKFIAAEKIALNIGVNIDDNIYQNLEQNNYFWNSNLQIWTKEGETKRSVRLIEIRLTGDVETIKEDCNLIIGFLEPWFSLEKRSRLHRCRPPKQNKARIYLGFLRIE